MNDDADEDVEPLSGFSPGRFLDLRPEGRGRNAVVFYAWDAHLDRAVVFKTAKTPEFRAVELDAIEAFAELTEEMKRYADSLRAHEDLHHRYTVQREGQLLAKINHPNVVAVHDVGAVNDDGVAVVLSYLGGGSLAERELPEPWEDVLDIMLAIGRGLAAIHAKGILHRDFKPNNVMFDAEGRPVIVDLGLACRLDDAGAMADWVGTAIYMAPEVCRQERRDVRDDVYAFCVVAFESFYGGELPFASAEDRDAGRAKTPTREGGMPRAVHDVIVRGLAPDPDERWPDMPTLLRALEAAASEGARPQIERRRWPMAIAWAAAALVLGVSLSVSEVRASSCDAIGGELDAIWNERVRDDLQSALGTRKAGDAMQDWVSRWVAVRSQECEAARPSWGDPWGADPGPTPCSASLRDRFTSTIHAFEAPRLRERLAFSAVLAKLPAPEHCLEHPDAADWGYGGPMELRDLDVEVEALLEMGELELARARLDELTTAARALNSAHGRTRARFWRGELARLEGRLDDAKRDFEAAYLQAWELHLPELTAEALLKLIAVAGEQGEVDGVAAHALTARGMIHALRPAQIAELSRVHGGALGGERGLPLLARAVQLRQAELRAHPGTRELLSQAQESYARALLEAGRPQQALESVAEALDIHRDEYGHGTWRLRDLSRLQFSAHVGLKDWYSANDVAKTILDMSDAGRDWPEFIRDVIWIALEFQKAGEATIGARFLRFGLTHATQLEQYEAAAIFDRYLTQFGVVPDDESSGTTSQ